MLLYWIVLALNCHFIYFLIRYITPKYFVNTNFGFYNQQQTFIQAVIPQITTPSERFQLIGILWLW
jgi:anionic cell wall polymer biosynthesis LytR-Cps2A-Psr (LCP) family protein